MNDVQNFFNQYLFESVALLLGGIFIAVNYLNPKVRERNKDLNETEDRLIKTLKDEVSVLTTKLAGLQETFNSQTIQIADLTTKYEVLAQVFQGRDEDSVKYRAEGRETMKIAAESKATLDALKAELDHHDKQAREFRHRHSEELQKLYEAINYNTEKSVEALALIAKKIDGR